MEERKSAAPLRSRAAILAGAKEVITRVGTYESNMVDIATEAEVSKATIYNHFRDKDEMWEALVESEIERLTQIASAADSPLAALIALSRALSEDAALRKIVETDPEDLRTLTSVGESQLWNEARDSLSRIFATDPTNVSIILRWLVSQISSPLTTDQTRHQAERIIEILA